MDLFLWCVAGELYDFHSVKERLGNTRYVVCRNDEKHIRKVIWQIDIEILETCVLLRIEYLKQCRSRISSEGFSHLVYLVDENHRIGYTDVFHCLYDLPRHCADICSSVTFYFSLIPHATYAEAEYLLSKSSCN